MPTNIFDILFPVFDMLFDFWPFILLTPLRYRKSGIRNMVYFWGCWAIIRIILFFNPDPLKSILIPEPLSTTLFFLTGLILIIIWVGVTILRKRRNP